MKIIKGLTLSSAMAAILGCSHSPTHPAVTSMVPSKPLWITGIRQPEIAPFSGNFPAAAASRHYQVVNAGYWIAKREANLEVINEFTLDIRTPFETTVYTRMILPNPLKPTEPAVYESVIEPVMGSKSTKGIFGPVLGLAAGATYTMRIQVFSDAARKNLVEEVVQPVVAAASESHGCITLTEPVKVAAGLPFPLACSR